jgi:hypothetical protein
MIPPEGRQVEIRTLLFEHGGRQNTVATLEAARERARALGIRQLVVASSHGSTALEARRIFEGLDVRIVAVAISAGFSGVGWTMSAEERAALERAGVPVVMGIHALGDDVSDALGAVAPNRVVRAALYRFCQGMKVAVEITLMAAEAGLLDTKQEAIAVVLKPACCRSFEELEIREVLAKPRRASEP